MDKDDVIYQYQPLWGSWMVDGLVTKGSHENVYKVYKDVFDHRYVSVVKVISVPTAQEMGNSVSESGKNVSEMLKENIEKDVKKIIKALNLLYSLTDHSHIISYEEHLIKKRKDGIGWDILIRMEYATSLKEYLSKNDFSIEEVLRLGIEMCNALEMCEKFGITHRDIKEENIFVSYNGVFKLGNFAIESDIPNIGKYSSRSQTLSYDSYSSDINALGQVLYRLLAGNKLAEVILSACLYQHKVRIQTPLEMKQELEGVLSSGTFNVDEKATKPTSIATSISTAIPASVAMPTSIAKSRVLFTVIAVILFLAIVQSLYFAMEYKPGKKVGESTLKMGEPAELNSQKDALSIESAIRTEKPTVDEINTTLQPTKPIVRSITPVVINTPPISPTGNNQAIELAGNNQVPETTGNNQAPETTATMNDQEDKRLPTAPLNLRVVRATRTTIAIYWDAANDKVKVKHYNIYRDGKYLGSTTTYTGFGNSGLIRGKTYTYSVEAVDAENNISTMSNCTAITNP